jgi:hypothetical protein
MRVLSKEHRAELKRLGDEHRLTRAEAAEHIFKAYLESEHTDVTQTDNTNTVDQTQTLISLEARIKALENQVEIIEDQIPGINQPDDMPKTEDNDGAVLELEIELDNSEGADSHPVVIDGLILEPDDLEDKDITQTNNTNTEQEVEPPGAIPDQLTGESIPDILDGIDPENITVPDRDRIVLKLYEQFPGKTQAKDRIKVLNDAGILFNGEPWTTKQYSDQLNLARRRQKS